MIKKFLTGMMILSLFLFFSCGSTKQDTDKELLEPALETEEVTSENSTEQQDESADSDNSEVATGDEQDEESSSEQSEQSTVEESEHEDINTFYPPLEEIEEPDLIDISPEEAEAMAKPAEPEENQITEPVSEIEELPPLAMEENPENEEASETPETPESIEPVIEIQPEEEVEPESVIVPSRSVSLKKGETLVITYPGNGWIYMGSTSEYNNLASRGRKLGTTDTKYTLLAKEPGTQIHHFYKVDNLTGEYIDDYIEVTVLEKKGNSSTVVNAPSYSEVVPKKPETPAKATPKPAPVQQTQTEETPAAQTTTPAASTTKTTTSTQATTTKPAATTKPSATTTPKETAKDVETEDTVIVIGEEETEETPMLEPLLEKARTAVNSQKYEDAYPLLTQYLEFSTDNRDEALYLLGQILESNSKYKDIKQAVETYQTLCDSYPASKYWDLANKRIVYLKRFYINIH